jgi:yecA family protein
MKSIVTKKEEKALKKLLSLTSMPEVTLSYYELRGFIYGIAITPDVIGPGEWMPLIFDEEMPEYESEDQARELNGTLFTVLNKHIAAFHDNSLFIPFDMENLKSKDFENIFDWTSGFEEALALRPECWEEYQGLSEEEHDHLMNSLVIIEGIVYPEDAIEMFDHLPRKELKKIGVNLSGSEVEKIAQIQFFMLQALELSVETIQNHAANLERNRRKEIRSSSSPFKLRSSQVGKNAPCPCGSGAKFCDCCGLPARSGPGAKSGAAKKGKVIKIDFPQHGKNRQTKEKEKEKKNTGTNYQLEITLSYATPSIWRRIQVPCSISLAELHEIIQLTMGWQDFHMHQFQAGPKFYGPPSTEDFPETPVLDESQVALCDLEKELLQGVVYTYDFGDNWEHVVMLEKVIPENEGSSSPLLLDGAGACPPEDIGGVPMYQELLLYLSGSEEKELRRIFDVPSLQGYDPDFFDLHALNAFLQKIYGEK